ncbi:MAG: arsenate reductase ArsC [Elusimicrobia bacterium]|nr:arsenate reductase ArsC [Elusimicrobiota bacterium]
MKRVLFLCTGNSCRSQMAQAVLNKIGQGRFEAVSAGSKPAGFVHPRALSLLQELGHPVDGLRSKSLEEFRAQDFDLVITVCDRAKEACPVWPGAQMIHWSFPDPAEAVGTDAERRAAFRDVYDQIYRRLTAFIASPQDR